MGKNMWFLMDEAKGADAAGVASGGSGDGSAGAAGDKGAGTALDAGKDVAGAAGDGASGAADGDKGITKGYWPEDWQKHIAGEDEKELKQLARYQSPADVWKKARSLEQRLSSGELKPVLPQNPKAEELAAWRKDNGIPDKPEAYDIKGIEIPKEDKDIVSGFLKAAHESNMTQDQARASIQSYYVEQSRQSEARRAADEEQRVAALDTLNQEWGSTFRNNIKQVEWLISKFPESVRDAMKSVRLPDGTAAFNHPDILRGFAAIALELNPTGVIVPASGGDLGKSALDEYKDIQKLMRENRRAYDRDAGKQARFTALIDFLTKNDLIDSQGNEIVQKRKAA